MSLNSFRPRDLAPVVLLATLTISTLTGCATGVATRKSEVQPWSVASLYPMEAGQAWSYVADTGEDQVLTTVRVERVAGEDVTVRSGAAEIRYQVAPSALSRTGGGFVLRAPVKVGATWASGPFSKAEVTARLASVRTPAGTFNNCAEVVERDSRTERRVATVYCPGVGPVRVQSELILSSSTARVTALLQGYSGLVSIGEASR